MDASSRTPPRAGSSNNTRSSDAATRCSMVYSVKSIASRHRRNEMADEKRPTEHVKLVEPPTPESVFDDIAALRKVSPLTVQRKKIITSVSVGKPPTDCYFRVHPDADMFLPANVVVGPGGRDDLYYVTPKMWTY